MRARTILPAGLDLLRHHGQAAHRIDLGPRLNLLAATRASYMARNLLDIRTAEARRGPTLAFAPNLHLNPVPTGTAIAGEQLTWSSPGSTVAALYGADYAVSAAC